MTITYLTGDPLASAAQVLALGHNKRGRTELGAFESALLQRYPTAFAAYTRQCRSGRIKTGTYWLWRESSPWLMFLPVRETSVGATRLRYVQASVMKIAQEYTLEGIKSLAVSPLGNDVAWSELRLIFEYWLNSITLPVYVYESSQS